MKPREIFELIGRAPTGLSHSENALQNTLTTADFRLQAKRRLPRPVFDYLEGGADSESSLQSNRDAFSKYFFVPSALKDVSKTDTSCEVLGAAASAPLGLAPTGYTRLLSQAGERGAALAAAQKSVPYVLSTVATTSLEDVIKFTGTPPMLQLYILKDRAITRDMMSRATANGVTMLEIAVDTAVSGNRIRDRRNGLTIPPRLDLRALAQIALKPRYWAGMVLNPALEFANVKPSIGAGGGLGGGSISEITSQFDPAVTWDDIAEIRNQWPGTLLLKGPLSGVDAAKARSMGVDGVHLSNHGGRQLDHSIPPLELVAEVRAATDSSFTIIVDSGVRSGSDIALALCLGADAAFVGRPYVWALVSAGTTGVSRMIDILTDELTRTMQLLGVTSIAELKTSGRELIRAH